MITALVTSDGSSLKGWALCCGPVPPSCPVSLHTGTFDTVLMPLIGSAVKFRAAAPPTTALLAELPANDDMVLKYTTEAPEPVQQASRIHRCSGPDQRRPGWPLAVWEGTGVGGSFLF